MVVTTKRKGKVYEYEYEDGSYVYRSVKFNDPNTYPVFSQICRAKGTNAAEEINRAVEIAVKKNLTLSEVISD